MGDYEMVRQIDRYLNGELTDKEVDLLWEEFLRNPEYLQWFEIEAAARQYFLKNQDGDRGSGMTEMSTVRLPAALSAYASWIYGFTAFFAALLFFYMLPVENGVGGYPELISEIPPGEMATIDVYRSADKNWDQLDIEINAGFESAMSGRAEEAEEIFAGILSQDLSPVQSAAANLNYGILLYNRSRFESASKAFENVTRLEDTSPYLLEKSWWYLAQSRMRLKKTGEARLAAIRTFESEGIYSNK
ncbi:MAG: hypothetical protein WD317_02550, partial [Balneolaceae bacterium]